MKFQRSAGILLHPSSLPGPFGVGTLGAEARDFVDFLAEAGIGLWQILPLGPTGYGDSPYQCLSSFAGNPYLIDPRELASAGLAGPGDIEACAFPNRGKVDFGFLFERKDLLIDAAWKRFKGHRGARFPEGRDDPARGGASSYDTSSYAYDEAPFRAFCDRSVFWLDDFALFLTIKGEQGHRSWDRWPEELRLRNPEALADFASSHGAKLEREKFAQFIFFTQWRALRAYAKSRGVRIIGDIPIFVARDSADTWAHPELFQLDGAGKPVKVAGVPPDYFTATGQLWGNPLYDWEANASEGYAWWISRIEAALDLVDILRIDHFRGFSEYWAVPAEDLTAERGNWEPGPGQALFDAIQKALGELPIIAEDLGFMTPEVQELRDRNGFPGMKILQFAFEPEGDNADYPHNYPAGSVVYTGTHDNDTCAGWLGTATKAAARRALAYVGGRRSGFAWNMLRAAWASPASMAVAPAQDLLGLGSEARMNFPGKQDGWWTWRMAEGALSPTLGRRLKALNRTFLRTKC
jgi:4-alpha-glucanotransferase